VISADVHASVKTSVRSKTGFCLCLFLSVCLTSSFSLLGTSVDLRIENLSAYKRKLLAQAETQSYIIRPFNISASIYQRRFAPVTNVRASVSHDLKVIFSWQVSREMTMGDRFFFLRVSFSIRTSNLSERFLTGGLLR
jgi:hypothetical protein